VVAISRVGTKPPIERAEGPSDRNPPTTDSSLFEASPSEPRSVPGSWSEHLAKTSSSDATCFERVGLRVGQIYFARPTQTSLWLPLSRRTRQLWYRRLSRRPVRVGQDYFLFNGL
jgi:hypothetical protein